MEQIEKEMKRLKNERKNIMDQVREGGRRAESVRQIKTIKNRIEKLRKIRREMILREKIKELEICYQRRDTRKYWNQLKEGGGWCRKAGGRIPGTAVDEKGEEHTGQEVL